MKTEILQNVANDVEMCEAYLMTASNEPFYIKENLEYVIDAWIEAFADDHVATIDGQSISDVMFMSQCIISCTQSPDKRPKLEITMLQELMSKLSIYSSNHKSNFLKQKDNNDELRIEIQSFIAQHYNKGKINVIVNIGNGINYTPCDEWISMQIDKNTGQFSRMLMQYSQCKQVHK